MIGRRAMGHPLLALLAVLALGGEAHAASSGFYLETQPYADRPSAQRAAHDAEVAGLRARIVRRFQIGKGWGFAVLVEGFADAAAAGVAAVKLTDRLGAAPVVYQLVDGKPAPVPPPAPPPTGERTAAQWLELARAGHGGPGGGASLLARAQVVHFVYVRRFETADGRDLAARHDYWRDGGNRRLQVEPLGGTGAPGSVQASLAIVNGAGAWITSGGRQEGRDFGVAIGAIDAFSPEAALSVGLDAFRLLSGPEVEGFRVLEGAESGVRVGAGNDDAESRLSFADVDPATGRLSRVRYVTEGGPIVVELGGYREVAMGLVAPFSVRTSRVDGRREEIVVERLDVLESSPSGLYDLPAAP